MAKQEEKGMKKASFRHKNHTTTVVRTNHFISIATQNDGSSIVKNVVITLEELDNLILALELVKDEN